VAEPQITATIRVKGLEEIQQAFANLQATFERSAERMRKAGEKVGAGLDKSMKATTATVKTTGTVGVRSFNLMKGAVGGLISILQSGVSLLVRVGKIALDVAGKVAAVGAGAFLATQAFGIQTGKSLDELGRMADAAGVPVERFSRLATAVRLLGGDVDDLSGGMQSLSEKIIDAAKDADGGAATAFAQLGLSVRDSNGNLKSTERMLSEVADGLASVPSKSLRASAAMQIFGGSASKLLPVLENGSAGLESYAKQADKLGTVVTEQQSKTARGLLVQFRKVGEALRGIAFRIADDLLPFLTQNSEKLADWLAANSETIGKFVGRVLKEISGISADLGRALIGDTADIERGWVKKVVPAIETARDVLLDLLDIFTGGAATRAPWLKQIGQSLSDAAASAKELGLQILRAAGFSGTKLPSLQEAATAVADAFASLRAGITGKGEIKMPWAANIGKTMDNLATSIGVVAGVIVTHREAITQFAADTTKLLSQGMAAIQSMLKGEAIAKDNPFAFLDDWKTSIHDFYDDCVATFESLKNNLKWAWDWFDSLAKALGFKNGEELGIILIVAKFTGLLDIVKDIAGILGGLSFTLKNIVGAMKDVGSMAKSVVKAFKEWGIFRTIGTWAKSAFGIITTGVEALAVALGLPVAAVVAIGVAIAALVVLAYIYWDDIKAAAGAAWDWIVEKWNGLAKWMGEVFDAAKKKVAAFWKWLKAAPGDAWDALVKKWDGFTKWIGDLFERAKAKLSEFWTWLEAAPGRAWDGLVSVWSGFGDFFSGLVDKVKGYFKVLWDGVKNGASDAWNSVKSAFGFGDSAPDGTADKSPKLATGGIIRGPGGPVGDKIRAWLSSGEGVLNARAVRHYGEGLVHALNGLMVPRTAFATGGIAGELVPATSRSAGLSDLHLNLLGQRTSGGLYADADGLRAVKRDLRKVAKASRGPVPRWRGY
jgi:hypothetical protein